jgi:hypothetical protein
MSDNRKISEVYEEGFLDRAVASVKSGVSRLGAVGDAAKAVLPSYNQGQDRSENLAKAGAKLAGQGKGHALIKQHTAKLKKLLVSGNVRDLPENPPQIDQFIQSLELILKDSVEGAHAIDKT